MTFSYCCNFIISSGSAPSIFFAISRIRFASAGSKPSFLDRLVSSAANCPGFILDGTFGFPAVSPAAVFLTFPLPSTSSSAAAASVGSVDDDAVVGFAEVLDRNR